MFILMLMWYLQVVTHTVVKHCSNKICNKIEPFFFHLQKESTPGKSPKKQKSAKKVLEGGVIAEEQKEGHGPPAKSGKTVNTTCNNWGFWLLLRYKSITQKNGKKCLCMLLTTVHSSNWGKSVMLQNVTLLFSLSRLQKSEQNQVKFKHYSNSNNNIYFTQKCTANMPNLFSQTWKKKTHNTSRSPQQQVINCIISSSKKLRTKVKTITNVTQLS